MDETEDVATATFQDVGEVVVVTGNHVARVSRKLPVLVGECGDLDLEGREEVRER